MEKYDGVILKPSLDEALEHYGVKGMKWKKRKAKNLVDKGYPSAESSKSYNLNLKTMQLTDDNYAKTNASTFKDVRNRKLGTSKKKIKSHLRNLRMRGYNQARGKQASSRTYSNGVMVADTDEIRRGIEAGRKRTAKKKK